MRGILQHHGRRIQIGGDVIQPIGEIHGARAEDALGAGDLSVENFVAHAGSVSVSGAEGRQTLVSRTLGLPRAVYRLRARLR